MDKIYNLDWKKYNNIVYDSISFQYFPKEEIEIQSGKLVEVLYELKEKGLINSYEDDSTEEMFFLTEDGRKLLRDTDESL